MVVKVYISGISGNKEVKKRQQRVLMILDSRNIKYESVDIAEPDNEEQKDFMQNNSTAPGGTVSDPSPRHPLPPQIFNETTYCGDYDQFDMSNEIDELEKFLKLAPDDSAPTVTSNAEIKFGNGGPEHTPTEDETGTKDKEPSPAAENEVSVESKTVNPAEETNGAPKLDDGGEETNRAPKLDDGGEETNGAPKLDDGGEEEKASAVKEEP